MIGVLTQKQAEERYSCFEEGLEYQIFLNLRKGKEYNGFGQYNFNLKDTSKLHLDFTGKHVSGLSINKKDFSSEEIANLWKEGHLKLPAENLIKGENVVQVKFDNLYNTDGNGLHSSEDRHGDQFIYCQTEPYFINRIFPVFDQPDLKGKMQFSFACPGDWQVVSNTLESKNMIASDLMACNSIKSKFQKKLFEMYINSKNPVQNCFIPENKYIIFNQTQKLSTYLYAFVGGPYQSIEYDGCDGPSPTPMKIYFNKDLLKYIQSQKRYIFLYYIKCIEFYEKFFQTKSPWEKYDTVICQEYTVGAMEFPGVITYTDRLIYQQENVTPVQVTQMGGVICHELAHMWFGNYVTMKWWNDLWLNESFADLMRYLVMHFINPEMPFETTDSWTNMLRRKAWGYMEDQRDTTHPIACEVINTSKADSIFDGITYSKGCAVLKQLYYLIGHQQFSDNLGKYFKKFAYKNATLKDFLEIVAQFKEGSEQIQTIKKWNEDWIEKAGLNEIEVQWDSTVQGNQEIIFLQTAVLPAHPTLRFQKLKFACFDENCKEVFSEDFVLQNKSQTKFQLNNKNYKAILANYGDYGYIKVILDKTSLNFFNKNLDKVESPLNQMLILRALFDMVKDGKFRATEFIDSMVKGNFVESVLGNNLMLSATIEFLSSSLRYIPSCYKDEYLDKLFDKFLQLIRKTKDKNDLSVLVSNCVSVGLTDYSISILRQLYDGRFGDLEIDFTIREKWRVVLRIHGCGMFSEEEKKRYYNDLMSQDKSNMGKQYSCAIEAMTDDEEEQQKLWDKIIDKDRSFSYSDITYYFIGFHFRLRKRYSKHKFIQKFFDVLPDVYNNQSKEVGKVFFNYGCPGWGNKEYIIKQLEGCYGKLKEERQFQKDQIMKKISDLKEVMKAMRLYE